jgi:hypothetical protein
MSYAPSQTEIFRRTADYVDKTLRGAKAAEIPVEQPTKFDLLINLTQRQGHRPGSAADIARPRPRDDRVFPEVGGLHHRYERRAA